VSIADLAKPAKVGDRKSGKREFKREPLTDPEYNRLIQACQTPEERMVILTLLDCAYRKPDPSEAAAGHRPSGTEGLPGIRETWRERVGSEAHPALDGYAATEVVGFTWWATALAADAPRRSEKTTADLTPPGVRNAAPEDLLLCFQVGLDPAGSRLGAVVCCHRAIAELAACQSENGRVRKSVKSVVGARPVS